MHSSGENEFMPQDAVTNFASAPLLAALTVAASSFSVASGQGAEFPASNFVVTIDKEILFISTRSTDTFTVASTGRGYDGTTAAAHASGATVELSLVAYHLNHLWQNTADGYHPDVPPVHSQLMTTGVPVALPGSIYDQEFESQGSWTLAPVPASGTTFTVNTSMRSHLLFQTNGGDSTIYTAYAPFTQTGPWTVTTKVSDAISIPSLLGKNDAVRFYFFVSDQNDPTPSSTTGNRIGVWLVSSATTGNITMASRFINGFQCVSGLTSDLFNYPIQVLPCAPLYLRMNYNGTTWSAWYGDGWIYNQIGVATNLSLIPRSLGFHFLTGGYGYTAAIDFCRVTVGSALVMGQ